MEPRIVTKPGFKVVGVKYRGKNENKEIPSLWGDFGERFSEFKHRTEEGIAYGVMDNFDPALGDFDYVAGVATSSSKDQPAGLTIWEIPESTYAVFTSTLPTIRETFDKIYQDWLPSSDYQRLQGPEFELYDERFDPQDSDSELDIYIPIEFKQA